MKTRVVLTLILLSTLFFGCATDKENQNRDKGAGIGAAAGAALGGSIGGVAGHRMDKQAKAI